MTKFHGVSVGKICPAANLAFPRGTLDDCAMNAQDHGVKCGQYPVAGRLRGETRYFQKYSFLLKASFHRGIEPIYAKSRLTTKNDYNPIAIKHLLKSCSLFFIPLLEIGESSPK
jgi:hypothetical protein